MNRKRNNLKNQRNQIGAYLATFKTKTWKKQPKGKVGVVSYIRMKCIWVWVGKAVKSDLENIFHDVGFQNDPIHFLDVSLYCNVFVMNVENSPEANMKVLKEHIPISVYKSSTF